MSVAAAIARTFCKWRWKVCTKGRFAELLVHRESRDGPRLENPAALDTMMALLMPLGCHTDMTGSSTLPIGLSIEVPVYEATNQSSNCPSTFHMYWIIAQLTLQYRPESNNSVTAVSLWLENRLIWMMRCVICINCPYNIQYLPPNLFVLAVQQKIGISHSLNVRGGLCLYLPTLLPTEQLTLKPLAMEWGTDATVG